jgi:hypothetical protein
MGARSRIRERRESSRFKIAYPAIYTRFDTQGVEWDQKPSRCTNVSLEGVGLETGFLLDPGEMLDMTIALEDHLVTFMGEVIYVIPSQDRNIESGISIKEIEGPERENLCRFIQGIVMSDPEHENKIIRMGRIICPGCGGQIETVARVKEVVARYKEFWDQCVCGQRYEVKAYHLDEVVLSFPDKQIEILC